MAEPLDPASAEPFDPALGPPATTIAQALLRAAAHPTHGLRFLDRKERATFVPWSEVARRAQDACGRIQALGIRPGERVVIVYPTSPEFMDAYFGVSLAGAVPVPVYPPVRLGRMDEYVARTARMVEVSGARLVLTDGRVRRVMGRVIAEAKPELGCHIISKLPAAAPKPHEVSPDDLGLVQFSSGTTVDPKPVALTHRALVTQAEIILRHLVSHPKFSTEGCSWLPLYHDMGLIGCLFVALLFPASLTLIGPEVFITRPAVWLRAMSKYGAMASTAPNFAYALCTERIKDEEMEGVDLSTFVMALNGAEPVAPEVLRAFERRFKKWGLPAGALTPVYGMSEAALAVSFSSMTEPFTARRFDRDALGRGVAQEDPEGVELVSVGRAVYGYELRVVDTSANEIATTALPDGRIGEVLARGPSLMREYLGDPEATARALVHGWLRTGDLGFFFEGQLYITGRAKDVLILRGRNHAPHPVEQAADGIEGVRVGCAAAVSHMPEGGATERLLLLVEHRDGTADALIEAMPKACTDAVRAKTGLNVDEVIILGPGTLPRTSSGKLRRREALRQLLAGELVPPEKVTALRVMGLMARSALAFRRAKST